ncbi:MAG: LD-carboxypeptidase [Thermodesulforhabdaceae bacterium]
MALSFDWVPNVVPTKKAASKNSKPLAHSLEPKIPTGATIALVAPAGIFNSDAFETSLQILHAQGYSAMYSKRIWNCRKDVCGIEWERVLDIIEFMKSPSVDAIWCIRGGYGSSQILRWLPNLPWDQKPVIGYSDISFLHFFIHSTTEAITFHGPNFIELATMSQENQSEIFSQLRGETSFSWSFDQSQVLRHGATQGKIIGGNLTCLAHLLGTPYLTIEAFHQTILFIEDINEKPYRIDRMLVHLRDAGIMDHICGLLIGNFTGCGEYKTDLKERILRICAPYHFPIVEGFPVGHGIPQTIIPMGIKVCLNTLEGILSSL